jgi:HEAT repeat protein
MRFGIGIFFLAVIVSANPVTPPPQPQPQGPRQITIENGTITSGSGTIIVNGRPLGPGQSFVQPPAVVPPTDPQRAGHEAEHETIAKCVADMKDADAEVRLRAILILGKYTRNFQARNAVMAALQDADAGVRRAALVALTEGTSYSSSTTPQVLRMLNDSDVHIRRIASSFLRQAMVYYRYQASSQTPQQLALVEEVRPLIIGAFGDEDATVRRNMMNSISYFSSFRLPRSVIANGLRDEDREVRILALQALGQFSNDNFVADLKPLVKDPDQKIRFHVADMLANLADEPEVLAMLKELAADEDFEVSTSATMGLLQAGEDGVQYARELRKRLDDPRIGDATMREFVRTIAFLQGSEYAEMISELLKHPKPGYRQVALEAFASSRLNDVPVGPLLTAAQDAAESVRSTALRYLGRAALPGDGVAKLAMSEHADVRRFAALYCGGMNINTSQPRFSNDIIEPIVMELLLDDDNQVRGTAVRTIVSRQLPDWEFIAEETLMSEDEYSIQQQVVSLLRAQPAHHGILRKALSSSSLNPNLRAYITNILRSTVPQRRPTPTIVPQRPTPTIVPRTTP